MRCGVVWMVAVWSTEVFAAPSAPDVAQTESAAPVSTANELEGGIEAARYVVGPGDRFRVELWGLTDSTQELEVDAEGRLVVPRAGVVDARGRTLQEVRSSVENKLRALYPRLSIAVTLARPRTFLVHVTGAVAKPGTYPATPMTRVSALLPRAGGALPSGSLRRVEVRRRGGDKPIAADLERFTLLGKLDGDPLLLDGDTIYVPSRALTVEIDGGVRRPGRYELIAAGTLGELLELAGGLGPNASRVQPVRVASRGAGDRVAARSVAAAQADATPLNDGDVVRVPMIDEQLRSITVEGAIAGDRRRRELDEPRARAAPDPNDDRAQPRRETTVSLAFVDGEGVRDVIAKAGGLEPWADAQGAWIARRDRDGARREVPVDLAAISTGERPDVRVEPGDRLIVPSRREQILVGGAVQRPGFYPYSADLKPRDYLALAGGPTRTGDAGGARVLQDGESRRLDKVKSLKPGDVVTVPEHKFTAGEWTTIALIIGNIAVGAAAIGVAAAHP